MAPPHIPTHLPLHALAATTSPESTPVLPPEPSRCSTPVTPHRRDSSPGRPRCTLTGHARPSWTDQQARSSTTSLLPRAPPCAAAVLIADRPALLPRSIRATVSIPQPTSVVLALVDRPWPLETPERPLAGAFHRADPPPQSPEPLRTPVSPVQARPCPAFAPVALSCRVDASRSKTRLKPRPGSRDRATPANQGRLSPWRVPPEHRTATLRVPVIYACHAHPFAPDRNPNGPLERRNSHLRRAPAASARRRRRPPA